MTTATLHINHPSSIAVRRITHCPTCNRRRRFYGSDHERGPVKAVREKKAKELCWACPVRVRCLDSAIERGDKYGIQGGLDEDERALERRRRMRRVNAA